MAGFPGSPRLLKGGLVLIDPDTAAVQRIIVLQYNPDTLTRSFQIQAVGETRNRTEALLLKGPPVESFKLDAEIDASDQLELPDANPDTVQYGIQPQLAVLETIIYPTSAALQQINSLAASGTLEILPVEAPLTHFVTEEYATAEFLVKEASDHGLRAVLTETTAGAAAPGASGVGIPGFFKVWKVWMVNTYK